MLAVVGIAAIPGVSDAVVPSRGATVHVSVNPASGAPTTHFTVSFTAAQKTGIVGNTADSYRVTASATPHAGCQASVDTVAPSTHAGATVRVTLSPRAHTHWCTGTFHGEVWNAVFPRCPVGQACPAVVIPPLKVGNFSFRVTRS